MNEKSLKVLLEANAVKRVKIIAQGDRFHIEVETGGGHKVVQTGEGNVRFWRSLESCARWIRKLGIGRAALELEGWQDRQRSMVQEAGMSELPSIYRTRANKVLHVAFDRKKFRVDGDDAAPYVVANTLRHSPEQQAFAKYGCS